jgi:hypothetical protein
MPSAGIFSSSKSTLVFVSSASGAAIFAGGISARDHEFKEASVPTAGQAFSQKL